VSAGEPAGAGVLSSLEGAVRRRGAAAAERQLADIRSFLEEDLAGIEQDLEALEIGPTAMHASAGHLLGLGGKRLRPVCVALAARVGGGFSAAARDLAVAAELVHSATLLHDDVVDLGAERRGAPAARLVYGNAASIFAGDWLLVEALVRVRRSGHDELLDRALGVLSEMLEAEAAQLDRRGRLDATEADYFRIVRGKTASLFRWALHAGATAGGLGQKGAELLERFGERLGVAFQLTDDLLDVDGDPTALGKEIHADLREGKATYPLIHAMARAPELSALLARALSERGGVDAGLAGVVVKTMHATGAIEQTRRVAERFVQEAEDALIELSRALGAGAKNPALGALAVVAQAVTARRN
jgi:octaprenyl-diphosphate synthase